MFSWFSKGPKFVDREYEDLSLMLTCDEQNVTFRREVLDPTRLDFSLESLKHIDAYLEVLRSSPPEGHDLLRVVLRAGAYVGEVMRKHLPGKFHWVTHDQAAKHSDLLKGWEYSISTAGILWAASDSMAFPLGKICKYLENGSEDSVYFFATVLIDQNQEPGRSL